MAELNTYKLGPTVYLPQNADGSVSCLACGGLMIEVEPGVLGCEWQQKELRECERLLGEWLAAHSDDEILHGSID